MALVRKEIDLHGYTAEQALFTLEQRIPRYYDSGTDTLLIICGKGEGILRSEILSFLRSGHCSRLIDSVKPGEQYNLDGGEGVIEVSFKVQPSTPTGKKVAPKKFGSNKQESNDVLIDEAVREFVARKKDQGRHRYMKRMQRLGQR